MRLEGGRLAAHLEEVLPDYSFAFEGSTSEVRRSLASTGMLCGVGQVCLCWLVCAVRASACNACVVLGG